MKQPCYGEDNKHMVSPFGLASHERDAPASEHPSWKWAFQYDSFFFLSKLYRFYWFSTLNFGGPHAAKKKGKNISFFKRYVYITRFAIFLILLVWNVINILYTKFNYAWYLISRTDTGRVQAQLFPRRRKAKPVKL